MPFFSLYLNIRGLQTGPGKLLMDVLESPRVLSVKEWVLEIFSKWIYKFKCTLFLLIYHAEYLTLYSYLYCIHRKL